MGKDNASIHILVTGGAGYIGSHACLRLLEDGYTVTALDNLCRGNLGAIEVLKGLAKPGNFHFYNADICDLQNLHTIFSENHFDVVMHFAAVAYVAESMKKPLLYYRLNTGNVSNILDAMRVHNVTRFIYSSTCATYGEHDQMPITETTQQNPINPYGRSKKMAEEIIRDYGASVPEFSATILRYFNVIGSDPEGRLGEAPSHESQPYSRITGACVDAAFGRVPSIKILGTDFGTPDGTCVRDYIHVTDLVNAHVAAMDHLQPGRIETFNVGTGQGKSVREFVSAWLKVTGLPIKIEEINERRPGDYSEVFCDPSKIQKELGWKATFTDLEEALRTAWKWQKAHPAGYASSPELFIDASL